MVVPQFMMRLALAAGLVVVICSSSLRAADQPTVKQLIKQKLDAKAAEEGQGEALTDEQAEEAAKERYQLPEGGVKELLAFIKDNMKFRPKSQQEAVLHNKVGRPAIKAAAEKIQEIATDEDKKLEGFKDVGGLLLYFRAIDMRAATPEEQQKLIDDIKEYLIANPDPSTYAITAANQVVSGIEYGGHPEMAPDVYRTFGSILVRSKVPDLAKVGEKMEGAARRLGLMGQPMEVSGTLMDGGKFDWDKYRGKVVLVDFWATWCGPCRAEMPNVKKNYELYHDKGFEVVGISLDRDRAKLEEFLEKEQNPWVTLHDGDWGDNAVATYYGVMGIPTVILVDKEGKVVSLRARGAELGRKLAELLGPAEPEAGAQTEDSADAAAK